MTNTTSAAPAPAQLDAVCHYLLELLEDITAEWDCGRISAATELGSMGIESINLVYLLAEVQQEYALGDGLLSALREEEIDIRGLRVGELGELVVRLPARTHEEARP